MNKVIELLVDCSARIFTMCDVKLGSIFGPSLVYSVNDMI